MNVTLGLVCLALALNPDLGVSGQVPVSQWTATVAVRGEAGTPLPGATVSLICDLSDSGGVKSQIITSVTDTNGTASLSHVESCPQLTIAAQKTGFYSTERICVLPESPGKNDDAKLVAGWNFSTNLTLRRMNQPIPMYAKRAWGLKVPVYGKRVGYDLMLGDWVGPYGKGVKVDLYFEHDYNDNYPYSNGDYSKSIVSFPKPGDGILLLALPDEVAGSLFRSPYQAPTNGYQPALSREISSQPDQPRKYEYDPNRIYLFRVRTVLNQAGQVVSAQYGKIYGDFMDFTYYLNPTANDRNLEFDPKQNLMSRPPGEQPVSLP